MTQQDHPFRVNMTLTNAQKKMLANLDRLDRADSYVKRCTGCGLWLWRAQTCERCS